MNNDERIRHERSAKGIEKALQSLAENKPELETVVSTFGPLLIAKAQFKKDFPLPETIKDDAPPFDLDRFTKGEPLFATMGLMDFHEEFKNAGQRLLPPMAKAFEGIREALKKIENQFLKEDMDTREWVMAFLNDDTEKLNELATLTDTPLEILRFVLGELIKPFMEMQASIFAPLTQDHQWLHGYCPICGSYAAISGLVGEGGKRWFQCAACAHEWRFNRHTCPRCNDKEPDNHEYFFDQDNPAQSGERVDVCKACNSYFLTIDLRQRIDPVNMDVAAMGMIALDILAQEKGYSPLAATPWNLLD